MENNELKTATEKLVKAMEKSNNLCWMFCRGVFYSSGWVFGLALFGIITYYILRYVPADSQVSNFFQAISNVISKNQ